MPLSPDSPALGLTAIEVTQGAATLFEVCPADWWFNYAYVSFWIIMHFLSFFESIMLCNFQEQILAYNIRLSAEGYSRQEAARMLGVSQECIGKLFATQMRRWLAKSGEAWGSEESEKGQLCHLGSWSAHGDDPPISEDVVNLEDCKQASGCWLLV